jgi:hypothetical protein
MGTTQRQTDTIESGAVLREGVPISDAAISRPRAR